MSTLVSRNASYFYFLRFQPVLASSVIKFPTYNNRSSRDVYQFDWRYSVNSCSFVKSLHISTVRYANNHQPMNEKIQNENIVPPNPPGNPTNEKTKDEDKVISQSPDQPVNGEIKSENKVLTQASDPLNLNSLATPPTKLSLFQKFKQMYKDYWYVLIPVHCVTSVFWAGGFYFAIKNGLDVVALLESMGISEKIINPLRNSSVGYYALTYALYKVASPARYAVTVGGTTMTINYLTRWGYIKHVPSTEKLQVLYQARKDEFDVKRENIRRTLRQHRVDLKKRISFNKKKVKK